MVPNESMLWWFIQLIKLQLSSNNDEAPEVIQTSNYYDQESLAGVFITNINSFTIFSLNCQSINAKIDGKNKNKTNGKRKL